ncbi:MAG: hypothetical protein K0S23_883 [Fluviicola sp.]|jgi:hypothetical protein|nr:hypothetical protein [Fluviicola sp.]
METLQIEIYKWDGLSWMVSDSGSASLEEFNELKSIPQ